MTQLHDYLTVKAAARYLGVAANTLRNWDRDGKIPVFRHPISKYRLFKKKDLDAVLREIERSGAYPTGWSSTQRRPRPK